MEEKNRLMADGRAPASLLVKSLQRLKGGWLVEPRHLAGKDFLESYWFGEWPIADGICRKEHRHLAGKDSSRVVMADGGW